MRAIRGYIRWQKWVLGAVVLVLLLTPLLVFFYIQRTQPSSVRPRGNPSASKPPEVIVDVKKSESGNVEKTTLDTGRYFVALNGKWKGLPTRDADGITGVFVADDDPDKHEIPVHITGEEGYLSLGIFTDSFGSPVQVKRLSLDEAFASLLRAGALQLRFVYAPDVVLTETEQKQIQVLDRFTSGMWNIPPEVPLSPVGVGVVE